METQREIKGTCWQTVQAFLGFVFPWRVGMLQVVCSMGQGRAHDYSGAGAQSQKRAVRVHAKHVPLFLQALITQYVD